MSRDSANDGPRSRPFLGRCAVIYAVTLLCAFGGYLEDGYPNDDGHSYLVEYRMARFYQADGTRRLEERSLGSQFAATLRGDVIPAHYVPTTTGFWHLLYFLFGERGWGLAVLVTGLLIHWAAAMMLACLLRRLGLAGAPAFLAGLLYLLHPVNGIGLSCSNGVIRIYGVALLLGAMLLWDRTLPGRPLRIGHLLLANLLFFLSLHVNPTFFASSPLLIFLFAGLQWLGSGQAVLPWMKSLTLRGLSFLASFGLAILVRLQFQGQLGSTHESANRRVDAPGRGFFDGLWENFFELVPPAEVADTPDQGIAIPAGHGPDATAWTLTALGVAVAAWGTWKIFRDRDPREAMIPAWPLVRVTLLLGGLVAFLPYVYHLVRGDVFLHRYLVVGLPAFGVAGAWLAGVILGPLSRVTKSTAIAAALAALSVAGLLCVYAEKNAASVASVVWAKRAERIVAEASAEILAKEPAILRVYVVNLPRTAGTAGMLFKRDDALVAASRRELWLRHGIVTVVGVPAELGAGTFHGETLLKDWTKLTASGAGPMSTAILHFDREALRVERLSRFENRDALTEPTAIDLPVPDDHRRITPRGLRSGLEQRALTGAMSGEGAGGSHTIHQRFRDLVEKPDYFLKRLKPDAKKYGRRLEGLLIRALEGPSPDIRRLAAAELAALWKLDADRRRNLLQASNPAFARAVVLGLEFRDDPADRALLAAALTLDETRALAALILARRGLTAPEDPVPALVADADLDRRALGLAALLHRDVEGAAKLVATLLLDDRLAADTRLRLREALVGTAQAGVLEPLLTSYAAAPPSPLELWALADQVQSAPKPRALELLARALATEGLRPPIARRLRDRWKKLAPEGPAASAVQKLLRPLGEDPDPGLAPGVRTPHFALFEDLARIALQERLIAGGRDAETETLLRDLPESPRLRSLVEILRAPRPALPVLSVKLAFPLAVPGRTAGGAFGALVTLTTGDDLALPGGPGPLTPRLHLAWRPVQEGVAEIPATARPRPLPSSGLSRTSPALVPLRILLPERPGSYDLVARLIPGAGPHAGAPLMQTAEGESLHRVTIGGLWTEPK